MAKYRVAVQTIVTGTVEVEVPDDMTDPHDIANYALENADMPTLCAQCSGWDRKYSMELGDEWEPSESNGEPYVYPA